MRKSVERFLATGLPPEKLLLGVGFYAKEKGGERRAVSWQRLTGDTKEKLPDSEYGFWPVGTAAFDLRLMLMEKHRLGGIMVWEFGHDSNVIKESLLQHLSKRMGMIPEAEVK